MPPEERLRHICRNSQFVGNYLAAGKTSADKLAVELLADFGFLALCGVEFFLIHLDSFRLHAFRFAGINQFLVVKVFDGCQRLNGGCRIVNTVKGFELGFRRLLRLAVLFGFCIQAADFLHGPGRVKRDFLAVVMHIHGLAVLYYHMVVFVQFQLHSFTP